MARKPAVPKTPETLFTDQVNALRTVIGLFGSRRRQITSLSILLLLLDLDPADRDVLLDQYRSELYFPRNDNDPGSVPPESKRH